MIGKGVRTVLLLATPFALFLAFAPPIVLYNAAADRNLLVPCFLAAGILHFVWGRVYAFQVHRIMRRSSRKRRSSRERRTSAASSSGAATSEPASSQGPDEGGSKRRLRILTHGLASTQLVDTPSEELIRDQVRNLRGRAFLFGILASLGLSMLAQIVVSVAHTGTPPEAGERFLEEFPGWHIPLLSHGLAGCAVALIYYLRAGVGIPTATFIGTCASLPWATRALAYGHTTNALQVDGLEGELKFVLVYLGALVLSALSALHRFPRQQRWQSADNRLLLLRVFGVSRNTQSLFRFLGRRWSWRGPVATITDPHASALRFNGMRFSLLLFLYAPPLLVIAVIPFWDPWFLRPMLTAPLVFYLCWLPLVLVGMLWRLGAASRRDEGSTRDHLHDESRVPMFGAAPSPVGLVCFDDQWRPTLGVMVEWAELVVMDLRGFATTKKGCEYELRYLMNHQPLEKTVFLLDYTTDKELFRSTLLAEWKQLKSSSPNAGQLEVTVHTYLSGRSGDAFARHSHAILGLLGELATSGDPE